MFFTVRNSMITSLLGRHLRITGFARPALSRRPHRGRGKGSRPIGMSWRGGSSAPAGPLESEENPSGKQGRHREK
jgi:hypothetical protein